MQSVLFVVCDPFIIPSIIQSIIIPSSPQKKIKAKAYTHTTTVVSCLFKQTDSPLFLFPLCLLNTLLSTFSFSYFLFFMFLVELILNKSGLFLPFIMFKAI